MQLETYHIYGAIFLAYIVIKEVFVLVKSETKEILKKVVNMEKSVDSINKRMDRMEDWHYKREVVFDVLLARMDQLNELWTWHNKEDSDGVKVWYIRSSLERSLHRLSKVLAKQHEIMPVVVSEIKSIEEELINIKKKLNDRE